MKNRMQSREVNVENEEEMENKYYKIKYIYKKY